MMVLFDEFDKTFGEVKSKDGEASPQAHLLSLFDGLSGGKKLFVITCNELRKLNDYLINRPGRFHYHFRFDYPSAKEIRDYLQDFVDAVFTPMDANYDTRRGVHIIPAEQLKLIYDDDEGENTDIIASAKATEVDCLIISRKSGRAIHYAV